MKKALIIDGNNLIFKAYYATAKHGASLHSLQGVPTNALYAFIRMINKFLTTNNYEALFVAFDAGKKTFRTERYESYKANRKSAPQELLLQIDLVKQFLDLAEIRWGEAPNYEADDLIGTMSKSEAAKSYQVSIISSDRDLLQLIDNHIQVLQPQKGLSDLKIIDQQTLLQEYQLSAEQIPDYKGLMGDSSDNLPGIKGIGPKTATKLLQKYQTLENVIAHVEDLPPKEQALIKANHEIGLLTKELATIKLNAPLNKNLNDCHYDVKLLTSPELQNFYKKYDMKSLIVAQEKVFAFKDTTVQICEEWDSKFNDEVNYLWTEICWNNYHRDPLLAIAIKNKFGTFYCRKNMIESSQAFKEFLNNKKYQKITWDIKKSVIAIKNNFNVDADGFVFDHMLASYLLYANENINFETIAALLQVKNYEELDDGEFYGRASKKHVPDDELLVAQYLEQKLNFLVESYPILIEKLQASDNWKLYQEIELPTVYSLITMEINGIAVDTEQLKTMTDNTKITLDKLEKELNQIAAKTLNPNSPKQISHFLFEELKLPNPKKGSTAYEVLITLKDAHPIIPVLIEYRKVQKLYATYLNGLEKYIYPDSKIHTIYNQVQASTGRISSAEPNMQNITVRDDEQREVRKVFIASAKNLKIVSCDYSQIELRILAHISNDENLINAFAKNHDIHAETASQIFNVSLDQVTREQRTKAKAVNFGIIYGISSFGLSQQLKISMKEAQEFIDKYFVVFPKIKEYINSTITFCQKNGYVESLFHRRRAVPEINDNNKIVREFGQRIAMNMPIQGTAADIIKLAMIKIDQSIKEENIKANLVAQIHDELIFEIDNSDLKTEMAKISEIMSNVVKLKVPLIINGVSGNNWYDLK